MYSSDTFFNLSIQQNKIKGEVFLNNLQWIRAGNCMSITVDILHAWNIKLHWIHKSELSWVRLWDTRSFAAGWHQRAALPRLCISASLHFLSLSVTMETQSTLASFSFFSHLPLFSNEMYISVFYHTKVPQIIREILFSMSLVFARRPFSNKGVFELHKCSVNLCKDSPKLSLIIHAT